MMTRSMWLLIALAALRVPAVEVSPATAPPAKPVALALNSLCTDDLMAHIRVLSSDEPD